MDIKTDTKKMLEETGWTQKQLARESGVHFTNLSDFLRGKKQPSIAEKLLPFIYGDKRPPSRCAGGEECEGRR